MFEHSVLRPYNDLAGEELVGEAWTFRKSNRTLRVTISTHPLGWQLRAISGAELIRSEVCRSQDEVFSVAAGWREAAIRKGWTEG